MSSSSIVEKLEGLKRRIEITVPVENVDNAYQSKVNKVATSAKIDGFRPGKVPVKVVEKRFGTSILMEVAEELIQSSFVAAVEENKVNLAGSPTITPKEIKRGQVLSYVAEFEVYPEITLADLSDELVNREQVEVKAEDIKEMLDKLLKQHSDWAEVDRSCQDGDRVMIDFEGKIDGELFENGSAQDFQLELGSGQMIPGFEDGIIGVKPGDQADVVCHFPKDYAREDLSGKEATFKITLHKVSEPKLPELTDDFAKKIGVEEGVDALKEDVKKNMQQQVQQLLHDKLKQEVMDKLLELNAFTVPNSLVDAEIEHLQQLAKQQMGEASKDLPDDAFPRTHFEDQANRRVKLGLLLGEVIKAHDLKVDGQKVRERIEQMASVYHDPEQVVNWYYNNKRMLAEVESVVLEDQAVAKLLDQMKVEDKLVSYQDAVAQAEKNDQK